MFPSLTIVPLTKTKNKKKPNTEVYFLFQITIAKNVWLAGKGNLITGNIPSVFKENASLTQYSGCCVEGLLLELLVNAISKVGGVCV